MLSLVVAIAIQSWDCIPYRLTLISQSGSALQPDNDHCSWVLFSLVSFICINIGRWLILSWLFAHLSAGVQASLAGILSGSRRAPFFGTLPK